MEAAKTIAVYLGLLAFCVASWVGIIAGAVHVWRLL
jgi:hypothetical protein